MSKQKNLGIEGSWGSQMIQLIRQYGYNKDMSIEVAYVVTPPPNLTIRLPDDDILLEDNNLIVAEHLLEHKVTASISGGTVTGATTCPDGGRLTSLTATDVTIKIKTVLQTGTPVILIGDNDTDMYYVVGKAVV